MKKSLIYLGMILVLTQIVLAGVTNPLPTELNLLKGESGRFKFQIQTIASNQEVECTSILPEDSIFDIDFDPPTIIVPAGTVRDIYGTVSVPRDIDFGTYEESFCIGCTPTTGQEGAAVTIETCGLPIKVNVVAERTRDNMYIPPKPFPFIGKVIVVAVILVTLAIIIYLVWKKKHEKPVKKRTAKKTKKKRKK